MAVIVPTITAENSHTYREQIERVESFAPRVHIDLMDGIFTPNKSVEADSLWWPEATEVDVHVMYSDPMTIIDTLIELRPSLIIVPAECSADLRAVAKKLELADIRAGLAVMPETTVESIKDVLLNFQHLLIFSGNLGHQGGSTAKLELLNKAEEAFSINPSIEIGWDGGVNEANVRQIAESNTQVINVGGFIQGALHPGLAYESLIKLLP